MSGSRRTVPEPNRTRGSDIDDLVERLVAGTHVHLTLLRVDEVSVRRRFVLEISGRHLSCMSAFWTVQ